LPTQRGLTGPDTGTPAFRFSAPGATSPLGSTAPAARSGASPGSACTFACSSRPNPSEKEKLTWICDP